MTLFVYMDDSVITNSDALVVTNYVSTLCSAFACEDLGTLGFFLSVEVVRHSTTLHLS